MFTLYRRHESNCPHAPKGTRYIRCNCPIWLDGLDDSGKRRRHSLKTRDWRHASDIVERLDKGAPPPADPVRRGTSVAAAIAAYLADCRVRQLSAGTIAGYKKLLEHLAAAFVGDLSEVTVEALDRFRAARVIKPSTHLKELAALRAFFRFCVSRKLASENPAAALRPPKQDRLPTLPFSAEELRAILDACERIDNPNQREIPRARLRARALVLLLAYSGLRISDAVQLKRSALDGHGRLMIRVMKTRVPLYVPLPAIARAALAALPVESPYFFWSGTAKLATAVGSARRTIDCVTHLAGVANGHPHRFRDTFAVGLLVAGEDLRTVQLLLGHESIRTTEKHYAPYVAAMQRRLDDAVGKLHFGLPGEAGVDALGNAGRDAKRDTRPPLARPN